MRLSLFVVGLGLLPLMTACADEAGPLEAQTEVSGWVRRFGDTPWGGLELHDLAVDDAGNRYLTGAHSGRIELDARIRTAQWPNRSQAFAASFDPEGSLRWFRALPTIASADGSGQRIVVDEAGRATLLVWAFQPIELGQGAEPLDEPLEPRSGRDPCRSSSAFCYLVALDAEGELRWSSRLARGAFDIGEGELGGVVVVSSAGGAIVLSRFDAEGGLQNEARLDATGDAGGFRLARGRGRVVLGGRYVGSVQGFPPRETPGAFLLAFDSDLAPGNPLILGQGVEIEALALHGEDTVVSGRLLDTASLGPAAVSGDRYGKTMFVARAGAGEVEWARAFAATEPELGLEPTGVAVGEDELFLVGVAEGSATFDAHVLNVDEPANFLLRLDPRGAARWVAPVGPEPEGEPRVAAVDLNGQVFVGGMFRGAFTLEGRTLRGRNDVLLALFDRTGRLIQSRALGGTASSWFDAGRDVSVDARGRIFVVGDHHRRVAQADHAVVGNDVALLSLDSRGELRWSVDLGGPEDDAAQAVAVAPSTGTSYVVGRFADRAVLGSEVLTAPGEAAGFLASFDEDGASRFALAATSSTWASLEDVELGESGAVYTVGRFTGELELAEHRVEGASPDGVEAVLARFEEDGGIRWVRSLGRTATDRVPRLATAPDDGVFILTSVEGSAGEVSLAEGQLVLARLDGAGRVAWSKGFTARSTDSTRAKIRGVALAADDAGNVSFAGSLVGGVDLGGGLLANETIETAVLLASFDSAGRHRWSRVIVGGTCVFVVEPSCGLASRPDGSVVLAARIWGTVDLDGQILATSLFQTDGFVARFDPAGRHAWSRAFVGEDEWSDDSANAVALDSDGNLVVTGTFSGPVDFAVGGLDATTNDMFILKLRSPQ